MSSTSKVLSISCSSLSLLLAVSSSIVLPLTLKLEPEFLHATRISGLTHFRSERDPRALDIFWIEWRERIEDLRRDCGESKIWMSISTLKWGWSSLEICRKLSWWFSRSEVLSCSFHLVSNPLPLKSVIHSLQRWRRRRKLIRHTKESTHISWVHFMLSIQVLMAWRWHLTLGPISSLCFDRRRLRFWSATSDVSWDEMMRVRWDERSFSR